MDSRSADNRVVAPATRTLEIQYLGVNLTAPENVVYRYRLEGLDESWQEAGRRTEAYLHAAPARHLHVQRDGLQWRRRMDGSGVVGAVYGATAASTKRGGSRRRWSGSRC